MSSSQALEALNAKRKKIASELSDLETKIYNLETSYIGQEDCSSFGTVLKGFDGFLNSKSAQARNKNRTFQVTDRAFSLSSFTSPASRELETQTELYVEPNSFGTRGKGYGLAKKYGM